MAEETRLLAQTACLSCKSKKRKCDRVLPRCELCIRTSNFCVYNDRNIASATDLRVSASTPLYFTATTSPAPVDNFERICRDFNKASDEQASFPRAVFLDIDCFRRMQGRLQPASIEVPLEVLHILNHGLSAVQACEQFFATVHLWFPFISKKRFDLGTALQPGGPALAMLILAIKLIVTPFEAAELPPIYHVAKTFLAALQSSRNLSLLQLQAMILVALYEYSHGLYPSAWMTIGTCARYADALGLTASGDSLQIIEGPGTWTNLEERRRAWWAIFILDQAAAVGSRRRCSFATPTDSDSLPVPDDVWNDGDMSAAVRRTVSSMNHTATSPFQLLCKSATLLGRAADLQRRLRDEPQHHLPLVRELADELHRENHPPLSDYSSADSISWIATIASWCLTRSALYSLLDKFCCPEPMAQDSGYKTLARAKSEEELALQTHAFALIQSCARDALTLLTDLNVALQRIKGQRSDTLSLVSPLAFDSIYGTAMTWLWIREESGDCSAALNFDVAQQSLDMLGSRWRLGREYQELITAQERLAL